jgi:hypothetical protein
MKSLVLATCVGSAAAVVAPQFQNAFYASGGPCSCVVERPFSLYQRVDIPIPGLQWTAAGLPMVAPGDFVVTDVVVGLLPSGGTAYAVRVMANGLEVMITQSNSNGYQYGERSTATSGARFAHGITIPAGHQITVEALGGTCAVTLAGYLK